MELSKDNYLVLTLKADRSKIAACVLHPFNSESQCSQLYSKYSVGEEIDIKIMHEESQKGQFILSMPKNMESASVGGTAAMASTSLEEGYLVSGVIKSIKGMCLYV